MNKKLAVPRFRGWDDLHRAAEDIDSTRRAGAVMRAYIWATDALEAAQRPKTHGDTFATRALEARRVGIVTASEEDIRHAIDTRRRMSNGEPYSINDCVRAAAALADVWHSLRTSVVTDANARSIARELLQCHGVQAVCLYGSLARNVEEPHDIDLLILDDGSVSDTIDAGAYADGTLNMVKATIQTLERFDMATFARRKAALCRWLDVKVFDGTRFGYDRLYTNTLQRAQPDEWFFVNISRDLATYVSDRGRFDPTVPPFPFDKLRASVSAVRIYGFHLNDSEREDLVAGVHRTTREEEDDDDDDDADADDDDDDDDDDADDDDDDDDDDTDDGW